MDDRRAQFLIAVGDLCTAAGLAGLHVQVRLRTEHGGGARGIPHPGADSGGPQADDTGYGRMFAVADRIIDLEDVEECTIYSPDRP